MATVRTWHDASEVPEGVGVIAVADRYRRVWTRTGDEFVCGAESLPLDRVNLFWAATGFTEAPLTEQQLEGHACRRCGESFEVVGSTSMPDGFGDRGQLFCCCDGFGCSADENRGGATS
jgi:hypothetical protein